VASRNEVKNTAKMDVFFRIVYYLHAQTEGKYAGDSTNAKTPP